MSYPADDRLIKCCTFHIANYFIIKHLKSDPKKHIRFALRMRFEDPILK